VQRGEEGHPREPGFASTGLKWMPWAVGVMDMLCVVAAVLDVRGCVHGRLQSGLRDACSFNLDTMGMSSPAHRRQPEGHRQPSVPCISSRPAVPRASDGVQRAGHRPVISTVKAAIAVAATTVQNRSSDGQAASVEPPSVSTVPGAAVSAGACT